MSISDFQETSSRLERIYEQSNSREEFISSCTSIFSKNRSFFEKFLKLVFYSRIRQLLVSSKESDEEKIFLDDLLIKYFPNQSDQDYFELQSGLDLIIPRAKYKKWKDLVLISSLLLPLIIIITILIIDSKYFFVLFELSLLGLLVPILLSVLVVVYMIAPNTFKVKKFPAQYNLGGFINELVSINLIFFEINRFEKSRFELNRLYDYYSSDI